MEHRKEVSRGEGLETKRVGEGTWGAELGDGRWQLGQQGACRCLGNQNRNNKKEKDMACRQVRGE